MQENRREQRKQVSIRLHMKTISEKIQILTLFRDVLNGFVSYAFNNMLFAVKESADLIVF